MYDSAAGRLLGVLVNPQVAFRAILRRPGWWPPLVAVVVAGLMLSGAFVAQLDVVETVRDAAEQAGESLTAEELTLMVQVYKGWLMAGWVIIPLIVLLFVARAFVVTSDHVLVGQRSRKDPALRALSRSIVAHSLMPLVVADVIGYGLLRAGRSVDMEALWRGLLIPSSLASLLPADAPLPLFGLLGSFDLFAAWIGFLLVTGFTQSGLMPARRALGTTVALWTALTVARVVVSFFG